MLIKRVMRSPYSYRLMDITLRGSIGILLAHQFDA